MNYLAHLALQNRASLRKYLSDPRTALALRQGLLTGAVLFSFVSALPAQTAVDGSTAVVTAAATTTSLLSVAPSSGSASQAMAVTLSGSNFVPGSRVMVSGMLATDVTVVSANVIKATLPAMSAGSYTVEVVNPDNSVAQLANAFTYAAALQIVAISAAPATVGQPYTASAEAAGGVQPYSWSLTSGSLPPGVSGTAQGTLSGSPTTAGTYNFTVQVKDSKGATSASPVTIVATKPTKPEGPAPTGKALTACQALNTSGSYYLANDVTCTSQGFAINANNVTLNLNGHTITYGSSSAVTPAISVCDQWYSALPKNACGNGSHAAPVITNGTITQATNAMPFTHAIWIGQANGISGGTISNLTINIQGVGAQAIHGDYPGVGWTIEDNTINDKVTNIQAAGQSPLGARSQFQGVAINLSNGDTGGAGDVITGNTINGSPQGGILDSNQNTHITNNVITLSSYYSNDYGVTVMNDGQVVTGNVINGRGRGLDAESSNFTLSHNTINVHEEQNNSEYGGCELDGSDGIRIKNYPDHTPSSGWTVEDNNVTVLATYCQAHGLRFSDVGSSVSGTISNNSFNTSGTQGDFALSFSGVDAPHFSYSSNSFAGSVCAQIDNDGSTDGANTSVQSGQSWTCRSAAVLDSDLNAAGGQTYAQRLAIGDTPSNHTITCGPYALGLITLGTTVTKQCGQ